MMKANFIPTKMRYVLCDAEGNPINNKIFEDIKQGENYIAFKSNGKWGLLDEDGNILHAAEFDDVRDAVRDYIIVKKKNRYSRYGILNKKAKVIIPIEYVGISYMINPSDSIYWICKNDKGYEGLYDEQFNNILPEKYSIRNNYTGYTVFANRENIVFFDYKENEIKCYGKDYGHDYKYKTALTIKTKENYINIYQISNDDDKDMKFIYYNTDKKEIDMLTLLNINSNKIFVGRTEVYTLLFEKKDGYFNIYNFDYTEERLSYHKLYTGIKIKNVLYSAYDKYIILRDKNNGWYVIDTSNNFNIVSKIKNVPKFIYSSIFDSLDIRLYRYEYIKID